jgi:NADH:ubiquinone oxidoreductase subunit 6 (subunit J)
MVIIAQHSVFSLLFLLGCFIFSSFLLFILECEFLALFFVLIYVGAVAILFLFSIMMLDYKLVSLSKSSIRYLPIGFFFGIILLYFAISEIFRNFESIKSLDFLYLNIYQSWYNLIDSVSDCESYGQILYSYFVLQILVLGLILLLVLIGVVYLTNNFNNLYAKEQLDFKQLARNSKFF